MINVENVCKWILSQLPKGWELKSVETTNVSVKKFILTHPKKRIASEVILSVTSNGIVSTVNFEPLDTQLKNMPLDELLQVDLYDLYSGVDLPLDEAKTLVEIDSAEVYQIMDQYEKTIKKIDKLLVSVNAEIAQADVTFGRTIKQRIINRILEL